MRIAVNALFLLNNETEGQGYFAKEVFFGLANQYTDHSFYFFCDRPLPSNLLLPKNVVLVVIPPKTGHFLSFKWWFDVKIPRVLNKHKIDVFVSSSEMCSLATRVPQVLIVHDLAFLHYPKFITRLQLLIYKTFTPKYFKRARVIAAVSNFLTEEIIGKYGVEPEKLIVVGSAARLIFKPIEWEERESVKQQFAGGCEYFVFVGGLHSRNNLMNLLKAFSLFKKRQHTNMKLLVAGSLGGDYDTILEKLKTYKFKDDVLLLNHLPVEGLAKLVAAAYALIYPGVFDAFGVPILEAMQCGVPVITSNTSGMPEVGGNAALYADPYEATDFADKMKVLFKDERLRSKMIEDGFVNAAKYDWQKTATLLWQGIQTAVAK